MKHSYRLIHGLSLILEILAVQSHQLGGLHHSAAMMYLEQIQICRNQKRPRKGLSDRAIVGDQNS